MANTKTHGKKPKSTGKHAGGRPRTRSPITISPETLERIDQMAEAQCKDGLIAEVIEMEPETFRAQFSARTRKKRAEGKSQILTRQYAGCKARGKGAVTERIWWGKQHLEQTDRAEVDSKTTITVSVDECDHVRKMLAGAFDGSRPDKSTDR